MEPLELAAKTPTRIPRPTFMASSPRTPSIRAVPYSHMDRATTSPGAARSYSPSSWPFPKSAKSSSLDFSATTNHRDAVCVDLESMSDPARMQSGHRATASVTTGLAATASLREAKQDRCPGGHTRANVSFDSVETQIYAPRHGDNRLSGQPSRPNSAKAAFLGPAPEILERPMTPTPYSILRKVSETIEPGNEYQPGLETSQQPSFESDHQETTPHSSSIHILQYPVARGDPINDGSTKGDMGGTHTALATPVLRDEEGRVLSRLHPPSRASSVMNEPQPVLLYAGPSSTTQAEYGSSDGGTASGPEGIVILQPVEAAETAETPAADGASAKNNNLHSRRPTTVGSVIPDLESLRRGPKLRHSRLPLSPSMAANAGRSVPKSTKKLWTALGRLRKMMLASAILLEISIVGSVSSITAVIVTHIEHGYPGVGLVAWAAVSSVFVLTFGALLVIAFLQYRKMNKDFVSGENWIEMHLRSRPLPPRPQSEERRQDNGATEAWQKFTQDHKQLRRYVEFLESRIGVLEEGQPRTNQGHGGPNVDITAAGNHASSTLQSNTIGQPSQGDVYDNGSDDTPKATKLNIGGSLSRRQLLQPEDSVTEPESWQGSERNGTVPKSDTKASILTELCEAVTEGYSPLSEQMPRGSPHVPQTPDGHTPSARQRGHQSLRHLVLPGRAANQQRGAQTAPTF